MSFRGTGAILVATIGTIMLELYLLSQTHLQIGHPKISSTATQSSDEFRRLDYIVYGLVQDYSNSIANALELLQSCTKPSMLGYQQWICEFNWK